MSLKKKKTYKKKYISTQLECINTARQHTSIDNYVHTGTHTHTHTDCWGEGQYCSAEVLREEKLHLKFVFEGSREE